MTLTLDAPVRRPQHVYSARGAALELFARRDPEVLLSGPAGTGKSRACLEKLHAAALKYPGMRGLIVRKVRDTLGSTGLVTWRDHVAVESLAAGVVDYYGGSAAEPAQYRFRNGSRIVLGGMDKPTKIMSSEYDMVYVQEAVELTTTDWENITTRLRNGRMPYQQLLADCNPDAPTHWLKARADHGATVLLNSRHEDNPILFGEDGQVTDRGAAYLAKLDALTGVRYERLRHGKWAAAEGLIYEDYDPQLHHRPIADPPHEWERYWTVDFGFTNPTVIQWWAVDPDGRAYLYRELYKSRTLVEDHARHALSLVTRSDGTWREPRPRAIICDHDAEDRATLERHLGMGTTPAVKDVSPGIQAVQARLRPQADGRPRIYLNPAAVVERDPELVAAGKPTCTVEEVPGYVWDRPTHGVAAERPPKEAPRKADDHGLDALRYLCAYLDLQAKPRVRWL